MDHDDHPVGRILSRREALALLAASGSTMLSPFTGVLSGAPTPQAPLPGCLVRPEV